MCIEKYWNIHPRASLRLGVGVWIPIVHLCSIKGYRSSHSLWGGSMVQIGGGDIKFSELCDPPPFWTPGILWSKVKVNLHTKFQGRRSNGSAVRALTDGQTDGRTDATKYIISLASRSIINKQKYSLINPIHFGPVSGNTTFFLFGL